MLVIFVAMVAEQRCVQRHLRVLDQQRLADFPLVMGQWQRKVVALCRTGIGGERAEAAARAVLDDFSPLAVLSLGFAGGVAEGIASGDLVLCERVYLHDGGEGASTSVEGDIRLLGLAREAARQGGAGHHQGNSATVPMALAQPEEKRSLAAACPVIIVEMESYHIGQVATARAIPFLCVRAVTDAVSDVLPMIEGAVTPDGRVRPWYAIPFLLGRPSRASLLLRWALNQRKALGSLSAFSREFLHLWSQEA